MRRSGTRGDLCQFACLSEGRARSGLHKSPDIIDAELKPLSSRSSSPAIRNRNRSYRPQVAVALQRLADAQHGTETGFGVVVVALHHPTTDSVGACSEY
jgi:hypothetical protein